MSRVQTPSGIRALRAPFAATLLMTGGCASQTVWLLKLDAPSSEGCETAIRHNFVAGVVPEAGGSEWTTQTVTAQGSELVFAQLVETGRGTGVLIVGDHAVPGERVGSDWSFAWTDSFGTATGEEHYTGYAYWEYTEVRTEWDITLNRDRGNYSGTFEQVDTQVDTWRESDTWTDEAAMTVGYRGQIPSGSFLVIEDADTGAVVEAENRADTADCDTSSSAPYCEIAEETVCELQRDFTATKTKLEDEAAYGHLQTVSGEEN